MCLFPQRERLDSVDSRVLDGDDLLDDVLTAPATAPPKNHRNVADTAEDEVLGKKNGGGGGGGRTW